MLGSPISHSKSPQLHAAAYEYLGVDITYSRIDLRVEQVSDFLRDSAKDFTGFSVTMPLKTVMVEQMSTVSHRVRTLGVLNTITVEHTDDGPPTLRGENTDVDGITAALRETGLDSGGGTSLAVIGAGATAAAAMASAAEMGFSTAQVYARSPHRATAIAPLASHLGLRSDIRPLEQLPRDLSDPEVGAVVSTLPPRAADSLAADLRPLDRTLPLLDVAYDPWPSALAASWQAAGGTVVSGMQMLLHQAVKQVELFTESTLRPAGELSRGDHGELVQRMRAAVEL